MRHIGHEKAADAMDAAFSHGENISKQYFTLFKRIPKLFRHGVMIEDETWIRYILYTRDQEQVPI